MKEINTSYKLNARLILASKLTGAVHENRT